jgi:hypothetical protein
VNPYVPPLAQRHFRLDRALRLAIGLLFASLFCLGMQVLSAGAQQNEMNPCVLIPSTITGGGAAGCQGVSATNPLPVTSGTAVTPLFTQQGGTQITGVFSGADTSSAAATLAGTAGKTTYICGFNVNGQGATGASIVNIAVATLIGGNTANFVYTMPAGATVVSTPVVQNFTPCIPANAAATAITVTVPGAAGNVNTSIMAWGYQL